MCHFLFLKKGKVQCVKDNICFKLGENSPSSFTDEKRPPDSADA